MNAIMSPAVRPFIQEFHNGIEVPIGFPREQVGNGANSYNCILSIGSPAVQIVTVVNKFEDLAKVAKQIGLIGKEADVIRTLCNNKGTISLADLGAICEWANPKKQFDDAAYRLNKKLKGYGWRLRREDGSAEAIRMPNPNRKAR